MEKIYWKKLGFFEKVIFILGWFNVLNLAFWIALLIYHVTTHEKKFWTPGSYRVVQVFGWIVFIMLVVCAVLALLLGIFILLLGYNYTI